MVTSILIYPYPCVQILYYLVFHEISAGEMEIIKTNEIVVLEESNVLDASCQPTCASSIKDNDHNSDESEICNEQNCRRIKEVTSH